MPPPTGPLGGPTPSVAWEDPQRGLFSKWWATATSVVIPSRDFYAAVARSEDPWPAITFSASVNGLIGLIVGGGLGAVYVAMGGFTALMGPGGGRGSTAAAATIMGAMGVGVAVVYPILFLISGFVTPWIAAGIQHLMLMMLGGANRSFMHTVRVNGYAMGTNLWMLIPCVGGFAQPVLAIMSVIQGLDEAHQCGTGKAAAAVLLPVAAAGLCVCGLYATLFAFAASGH